MALLPAAPVTLHEPFAGSAALSLAMLAAGRVDAVVLNDLNGPLVELWAAIVADPERLAADYARHWHAQAADPAGYYTAVRADFNADPRPDRLLFLLARCVKAAVRYNTSGQFNQSPDRRRLGARPEAVRRHLLGAHRLLAGRVTLTAGDYRAALAAVGPDDVAYLDPPYAGVSTGRDARYLAGVAPAEVTEVLADLVRRGVSVLLSYDGRSGDREYGRPLPAELGLRRLELDAGRSAAATLHRRAWRTVESVYLSPALAARLPPETWGRSASAASPRGATAAVV